MRYKIVVCMLMLLAVFISGCASKAEEGALKLRITGKTNLNTYNRQAHTLSVVIYQLSDSAVFEQMTHDYDGAIKLLEGGSFHDSIVSNRRLVIHPGKITALSMPWIKGAKFMAIIGGFDNRDRAENFSRIFPIEPPSKLMNSIMWSRPIMEINIVAGSSGFLR